MKKQRIWKYAAYLNTLIYQIMNGINETAYNLPDANFGVIDSEIYRFQILEKLYFMFNS